MDDNLPQNPPQNLPEPNSPPIQPIYSAPISPVEPTIPQVKPLEGETVAPQTPPPSQPIFTQPTPQPVDPAAPNPAKTATYQFDGGIKDKLIKILIPLLIVIVLGVIGFFLYKTFGSRFIKPKETTITYWGLWESESVMASLIADYQKAHPEIKINYQLQSPKEYRERLQSSLARNEGPDIFRFHNTWVPMLKNDLAPVPNSIMANTVFESTYYPVVKTDLKLGSGYAGLPLEIDGLALYINKEIFRNGGKTAPATWDELRKTASELTVRDGAGKIQISGVALGRTENVDNWSDILGLMMLQNSADPANPSNKNASDAMQYFTLFSRIDKVWDETLPPSTTAFAGGKVAMIIAPSWRAFEIKQANPQLDFEILPAPQLPDTNTNWATYWVEGVSKKSTLQSQAWAFLNFLSSKEAMEKLYQAESKIRTFGEPYSRVEMANLIKDTLLVGAYIKQAPTYKSWYLSSRTHDNGINDKIIKYYEDAINSINQGKTAEEALETTTLGITQILSQYGLMVGTVR